MTIIILILVVVLILVYVLTTYNKMVRLRNQTEESAASIDAHLKQRYDLIPNLVEVVKGYAKHESETLTAVIEARNKAVSATSLVDKNEASNAFSTTLKSLFALSESYPDLKANANFLDLQKELQNIERQLLQIRKYYNAVVKEFNTLTETIPSSLVAKIGKFNKQPYLEIEEEARQNVKVSF